MSKKELEGGFIQMLKGVSSRNGETREEKVSMVRKNIAIEEDLHKQLKLLSVQKGVGLKDLVAEAIRKYISDSQNGEN